MTTAILQRVRVVSALWSVVFIRVRGCCEMLDFAVAVPQRMWDARQTTCINNMFIYGYDAITDAVKRTDTKMHDAEWHKCALFESAADWMRSSASQPHVVVAHLSHTQTHIIRVMCWAKYVLRPAVGRYDSGCVSELRFEFDNCSSSCIFCHYVIHPIVYTHLQMNTQHNLARSPFIEAPKHTFDYAATTRTAHVH